MTPDTQTRYAGPGFLIGLMAGAAIGAGLALWLAPRAAAEAGERATDAARSVRDYASDRYREATTRVAGAVDDLASAGQGVRDDAADAVVRVAQRVERVAKAAKA
jgi:gas vesicle protein